MASELVPPGLAAAVTSNSNSRQAPAILSAEAIWRSLSQTLARKLIPSKQSQMELP